MNFIMQNPFLRGFLKIILLITKISLKRRTWKALPKRGKKNSILEKAIVKCFDLIFLLLDSWQYYASITWKMVIFQVTTLRITKNQLINSIVQSTENT